MVRQAFSIGVLGLVSSNTKSVGRTSKVSEGLDRIYSHGHYYVMPWTGTDIFKMLVIHDVRLMMVRS